MTDEQRSICLRAVDHYGVEHQKRKAVEELSELITELSRESDGRTDSPKIREELADVFIMCEQLRIIYCPEQVDSWINNKLERLERRINGDSVPVIFD